MIKLERREGIVLEEIHGVYLLMAVRSARNVCGYIRQVNEIGAEIWEMIGEHKSPDEMQVIIQERYMVPEGCDLLLDINEYIRALYQQGYLMYEAKQDEI